MSAKIPEKLNAKNIEVIDVVVKGDNILKNNNSKLWADIFTNQGVLRLPVAIDTEMDFSEVLSYLDGQIYLNPNKVERDSWQDVVYLIKHAAYHLHKPFRFPFSAYSILNFVVITEIIDYSYEEKERLYRVLLKDPNNLWEDVLINTFPGIYFDEIRMGDILDREPREIADEITESIVFKTTNNQLNKFDELFENDSEMSKLEKLFINYLNFDPSEKFQELSLYVMVNEAAKYLKYKSPSINLSRFKETLLHRIRKLKNIEFRWINNPKYSPPKTIEEAWLKSYGIHEWFKMVYLASTDIIEPYEVELTLNFISLLPKTENNLEQNYVARYDIAKKFLSRLHLVAITDGDSKPVPPIPCPLKECFTSVCQECPINFVCVFSKI
ncbi:hypothetical protein [Geoglobus sp.]